MSGAMPPMYQPSRILPSLLTMPPNTTFRGSLADGADAAAILRLASDPEGELPDGPVLFAEVDGDPVAAIGIADGRTVAASEQATLAVRARLHLERLYVRAVHTVWGA